jgi:hypothetical protein
MVNPARRSANAAPHRFLLRLPPDLHRVLTAGAQRAGLSLNEFCVQRLGRMTTAGEADAGPAVAHARRVVGPSLVGVLVHGSWARGESRATSDVDLLVVIDREVPLARALYTTWDEAAPSFDGRPIDAHFVHLPPDAQRPSAVWCEAALDGLVIADRDGAVVRALYEVRRAIAEGHIVRRRVHGQSYWTTAA